VKNKKGAKNTNSTLALHKMNAEQALIDEIM
jgi:hypothetical protein